MNKTTHNSVQNDSITATDRAIWLEELMKNSRSAPLLIPKGSNRWGLRYALKKEPLRQATERLVSLYGPLYYK